MGGGRIVTAAELLRHLQQQGISLRLEDGRLRYSAPSGALDPGLREQIRTQRVDLVRLLRAPTSFDRHPGAAGPVPLSWPQQSLWLLDRMYPGDPAANEQFAINLRGDLEVPRLEDAWNELFRRHAILRVRVVEKDGEPQQVADPPVRGSLVVEDVSEADDPVAALAGDEIARRFVLEAGGLVRARLLRLSSAHHILLVTAHHIILDGLCVELIRDELAALYMDDGGLDPQPPQYVDFARAQRAEGPSDNQSLEYWRAHLFGAPQRLDLPARVERIAQQDSSATRLAFSVDAVTADALRELARDRGATLFMTLMAATRIVLGRYSGQRDVLLGSPVTLRNSRATKKMLGCMVNNVVFRNPVSPDIRFDEFLLAERTAALAAYEHSAVPFEQVVATLSPLRESGTHPLFQALLLFEDRSATPVDARGVRFGIEVPCVDRSSYWDLEIDFSDHGSGATLTGFIGYRDSRLDAWLIRALCEDLVTLLQTVVRDARASVDELCRPSALMRELNDVRAPEFGDGTLHGLFEAQARRVPDATALVDGSTQWSYAELDARSAKFAAALAARGVGPGALVGLRIPRSVDQVAALLAILRSGAAVLPLDPAWPAARTAAMLREARPVLSLVAGPRPRDWPEKSVTVEIGELAEPVSGSLPPDPGPGARTCSDGVATVLFTSGSTGIPKGVVNLHAGAVSRCRWMWQEYGFGPEDVFCLRTSLNFVDALWEIFGALGHGIPLVVPPVGLEQEPAGFLRFIEERRVSHLVLVPSLLNVLLERMRQSGGAPRCLRSMITSGEPLTPELAVECADLLPSCLLINTYGTTETWDATAHRVGPRDSQRVRVPIGRPIANMRACVLDEQRRLVPVGVWGELYVGGLGLAQGYLGDPRCSAESFVPDTVFGEPGERLYRTGDIARVLPDGEFELLGRADRQIKVRGYRVEPAEVEALLLADPRVDDAVVAQVGSGMDRQRLLAWVVGDPDPALATELRASLVQRLPSYMVPDDVHAVEQIPLTPNGKLDLEALSIPERATVNGNNYSEPGNETEDRLAEIWAEVLAVERVGVHDDFFELRGHSLLAARLMSRVCDTFCLDLPLQCLFEAPTVAGMARSIEAVRWALADEDSRPDGSKREVMRL